MKQEIYVLQLAQKPLRILVCIDWHRLISILEWKYCQLNISATQKILTEIILLV